MTAAGDFPEFSLFSRRTHAAWLRAEMRENKGVYVAICVFVLCTFCTSLFLDNSFGDFIYVYFKRALRAVVLLCSGAIAVVGCLALVQKSHDSPLRYMRERLFSESLLQILVKYLFACIMLTLFMGAFLYNKTEIPLIVPFSWDPVFTRWDLFLFGGHHPWEILRPLFGLPPMVRILDFLYSLWVPMIFVIWAGLFASPRVQPPVRKQFWIATIVSWTVIGLIMATIFSSAGPCFAPRLFSQLADDYGPLNAYLAQVNAHLQLASSLSKAYLWGIYTGALNEPGGISAMPSMHNAQAMLFTLTAFRISRRVGSVMAIYQGLIFVGSIMLAWHYAVDGIVGSIAAAAIWHLSGVVSRRSATNRAGEIGLSNVAAAR